jgi:hypothetical protein
MNIQGPLLLLGVTATTTVGLGTVAVNSGAVNIDDVSGLLAETISAVSGTTAGQGVTLARPGSPSSTAGPAGALTNNSVLASIVDGSTTAEHGGSGGSTWTEGGNANGGSTTAGSGTSTGTNHGNSSGSSGSYGSGTGTGSNTNGSTNASGGNSSGNNHGSSSGSTSGGSGNYEEEEHEEEEHEEEEHEEEEHEEEEHEEEEHEEEEHEEEEHEEERD